MKENLIINLAEKAYQDLYNKLPNKKLELIYSGRLKDYNAHIISTNTIKLKLSKKFQELDEEIQMGVIQHLLTKLYKTKKTTLYIDLYNKFLKNLGEYETAGGGKTEDQELQDSFDRVNKKYFNNFIIMPNIHWGGNSKSRLGYYEFSTDRITLSTVLKNSEEFLDYVLYHELLHKIHKFQHKNGRTHSHTKEFRADEKKFVMQSGEDPEKALHKFLRSKIQKKRIKNQEKTKRTFVKKLLDFF